MILNVMWLKVDRCLPGYEKDMFICACYIIPAGSTAIENSDVFDKLMNDMTGVVRGIRR